MRQLNPGDNFPITRQLDDPSDSTTYYVRAYVRWADSDALITTVDLTDKGDQRFRGTLHVPEDKNGGAGSHLTITTKVFTDSGYTSIAENYRIFEEEYLVFPRRNPFLGMGATGGGSTLTAKQVREIVRDELGKLPPVDLSKLQASLLELKADVGGVRGDVKGIEIPEPEKLDLGPVLAAVEASQQETARNIQAIPKPDPVDLTPITSRLDVFEPELYQKKMDQLFARITDFFRTDMTGISRDIAYIRTTLEGYAERIAAVFSFAKKGPDEAPAPAAAQPDPFAADDDDYEQDEQDLR